MTRLSDSEITVLDQLVQGSVARVGPFGQGGFESCSLMFLSADFRTGTTLDRKRRARPFSAQLGALGRDGHSA